jgi:CRISPR/Cas system-associated exonuclease Cas4 (RecB family)
MTLPTISASKIKTFKMCPRKYKHRYIDGIKDDSNISAVWGKSLHTAIQMKYLHNRNPIIVFQDEMIREFDHHNTNNIELRGEEYYNKFIKLGKDILSKLDWSLLVPMVYEDKMLLEQYFIFPFPFENPICQIEGYIDLIDQRGYVVDHKSGKEKPTEKMLNNDVQFIIYYWAYLQEFKTAPTTMYWHHLRTQTLYTVDVHGDFEYKCDQLKQDIQALLATELYHRKEHDSFCEKYCPYFNKCFK